jgi:hypothetical protein
LPLWVVIDLSIAFLGLVSKERMSELNPGHDVERDEAEVTATRESYLSLVERPDLEPLPGHKASTRDAQSHQADT